MSNPKIVQKLYLQIWNWPDHIKQIIGTVGDWLQYLLPISILAYCLIVFGITYPTYMYVGYFIACVCTSSLIKALFNNIRPRNWDDISTTPEQSPDMNLDWSPREGNSFVSGHTAAAFAAVWPAMLINPLFGVITLMLALFVGFSRMVVKAHWLRDVLGSIVLDSCIALIFYCVM